MHVSQVMNTLVHTICPTATLCDAARQMQIHDVGLLPVLEDGAICGVVTDRDIVIRGLAPGLPAETTPIRDIMTREVDTVSDYQHVDDVAELMERKQLHRVLVLDRDNYVVGVVSLSDLATRLSDPEMERAVLHRVSERSAHRPAT